MRSHRESTLSFRTSLIAALPGLVIALLIWLITFTHLNYAEFVDTQYALWQSLGRGILTTDPIGALLALHIQPPGLNILEATDLAISPGSHLFLALIFLAMLLGALYIVVDTVTICGLPRSAAAAAGVLYAVLPVTVIYSLWPFSTGPTMFGSALAVWGVARMRAQPVTGVVLSSIGVLVLLLTRSSFAWPFAVCWLSALGIVAWRTSTSRRSLGWQSAVLGTALVAVIAVQGHYFLAFGIPTMSSWTGENLAKALTSSGRLTVTPEAETEIRKDPCHAALLDSLYNGSSPIWSPSGFRAIPACSAIPALAPRGTAAWDSPEKDGVNDGGWSGNFNWSERLVASRAWNSVMQQLVLHRPSQLLAMAVSSPSGARQSSLGIYLGPSEDFSFVSRIRSAYPLPQVGGLLSLIFAPAMLILGLIGAAFSLARRRRSSMYAATLYFSAGFILFHIAASTLFEYGENMRFQAEAAPVFVVFGLLGCYALMNPSHLIRADSGSIIERSK